VTADEHLSFDELAELAEGLLARRKAAAAQAHLESCDECSARVEALQATTSALGALGPLTMPADVVARLGRALAGAAQEPVGDTVVPEIGAVRRRRLSALSWPYAAAASVVIVAVIGVGIATLDSHHHNASGETAEYAAEAPLVGTSAPSQVVQEESGQTYTPSSLSSLVPSLVSGAPKTLAPVGVGAAPEVPAPSNGPMSHGTVSGSAGSSGTKSTSPKLAAPDLATQQRGYATNNVVPPSLRRYADSKSALDACAAYITDTSGAAPLAVDFARWSDAATHVHDAPSLILVFADPSDKTVFDVYVVAPACDSGSLRDFTTVSR
jgi:hypothetical protein